MDADADLVEDPVLRQRYRFARTGELLRVEVWADPGSRVPPHFHPALEERWHVLEGEVTFRIGGRKRAAGPGDRLRVEPGMRHSFVNTGREVARIEVEAEPALQLQEFLEEAAALGRAGRYRPSGIPRGLGALLEGADFAERYRDTTVLAFPPPLVQRVLLPSLARLGRRRRA
jgi:quercetin dioxygenase-like cupin family protein